MLVYRLGNSTFIDRLDGEGAAKVGGRWNQPVQRMIYTAQTSSLAILEVLGHLSDFGFHVPYKLIELSMNDALCIDYTQFHPELPEGWSSHQGGGNVTQAIGSEWVSQASSPYLKVPSVHNPLEHNYLLNPIHPDFEVRIMNKHWYLYHDRLRKK